MAGPTSQDAGDPAIRPGLGVEPRTDRRSRRALLPLCIGRASLPLTPVVLLGRLVSGRPCSSVAENQYTKYPPGSGNPLIHRRGGRTGGVGLGARGAGRTNEPFKRRRSWAGRGAGPKGRRTAGYRRARGSRSERGFRAGKATIARRSSPARPTADATICRPCERKSFLRGGGRLYERGHRAERRFAAPVAPVAQGIEQRFPKPRA
jgi:hypothetical protein